MTKYIAVIDESGKQTLEYVCLIVGDHDSISKNLKNISHKFTHMNKIPENEKRPLLDKFDFTGKILVCCMKLFLIDLRVEIDKYVDKKKCRKNKRNLNQVIGIELRSILQTVILNNNDIRDCEIDKLTFQVDNDTLRDYLKASGLKTEPPKDAHKLADCVAHANFKRWKLDSVVELVDEKFKTDFHEIVMDGIRRFVK
ncbi:MAG TPA: hypothetical protein VIA08_00025 [Nitrososphaeraceae archaeon]